MSKLNLLKNSRNFLVLAISTIMALTLFLSIMITGNSVSAYDEEIGILGAQIYNNTAKTQVQQNNNAAPAVDLTDYEAAIIHLINTIRAERGLAALQPHQSLVDISRTRSQDMLARNYFSHYTPEGKTVFNIFRECGITFRAAGENLAHSRPAHIGTPEAFMHAWMNSPTHAANILSARYGIIGIGMTQNNGRRVLTTVFRNS